MGIHGLLSSLSVHCVGPTSNRTRASLITGEEPVQTILRTGRTRELVWLQTTRGLFGRISLQIVPSRQLCLTTRLAQSYFLAQTLRCRQRRVVDLQKITVVAEKRDAIVAEWLLRKLRSKLRDDCILLSRWLIAVQTLPPVRSAFRQRIMIRPTRAKKIPK